MTVDARKYYISYVYMLTQFASDAEMGGKNANDICFSKMAPRTASINM